ncbi:hypothetical protein J1N35_025926 [Gossypium stocksii]|uniref:Uncharacterized protein n=1 Tax=Gossypium stocksii TaxID=47602 RepID=A0A9D3V8L1_9ROSI|nr:hypothetical protein J1N35_025926 [Gossypium stocksii]
MFYRETEKDDPNWNIEEDSEKDLDSEIEDPDNDLDLEVEENPEEDLDEFLASIDPYMYELFDVISGMHLKRVISLHISSRNVIELSIEFTDADGFGPSSTTAVANTGTEAEGESPTIQFCNRFYGLHQNGYSDVLETSTRRHSLVSGIV